MFNFLGLKCVPATVIYIIKPIHTSRSGMYLNFCDLQQNYQSISISCSKPQGLLGECVYLTFIFLNNSSVYVVFIWLINTIGFKIILTKLFICNETI